MSLLDRFKRGGRSLAEPSDTGSRRRPLINTELGVSGDFTAVYNREEARKDTRTIADYRRMLDNDGTAEAIYNMMTWPIKGAGYHFEAEDGATAELQFVEDNFTLPPHKGGMSLPFDLFIADLLRALVDGFRLYEKVWTLKDGKYVYRKLAPRDSETVGLRRDEHGGFDGAQQRTWNGTKYVDVTIPVDRCFLFTYAKERDFLNGRSAFKTAYYHYDRKHKLYYLQQLGAETGALPPRKLTIPTAVANNAAQREEAERAAREFGIQQVITLPEGFDLDEYKTNPQKLKDDIEHHDSLIARSVLAQFLVLGQQGTGSYSLSKDQSELFIEALQGTMRQIEHHINAYLIPDLINFNFGSARYPEFKFEDLDKGKQAILAEAFKTILSREDVPPEVIQGIAKQVAGELGIETGDDKKEETATDASDKQERIDLSEQRYARSLTEAEKRVNLSELDRKAKSAEERLTEDAGTFYGTLKDDTIKRLTRLLDKGDVAKLKAFELSSFTPYRKLLEEAMMSQYLYGKRTAADEVSGKIPQTPSKSRQYVTQQAAAIADKQQADLTFIVRNEVTKELRKQNLSERQLGVNDIMARLSVAWASFMEKNVETGVAVTLVGALNLGRGDSFGASNDIDRMQYSAILDIRTSPLCRSLDDSVVTYEEYKATKWVPPCHFNCRSIWVAILKDDDFKPDFKPIPAAPGGYTEPQLSDNQPPTILDDRQTDPKEVEELQARLSAALKKLKVEL